MTAAAATPWHGGKGKASKRVKEARGRPSRSGRAVFCASKRSHIFIEEVLEPLFGKEGVDHLEDHGALLLVQLLHQL